MALFKISKGTSANLPTVKKEGFAYVTTDDANFYIDVSDTVRIRIGDINMVPSDADLPLLTARENGKWYFVEDSLELKTYVNGGWFTLNSLEALDILASKEEIDFLQGVTSNIQEQIDSKLDNFYLGTCGTAGSIKDKVATVEGNFKLKKGVVIGVLFSYANTAQNPTLNINGTGAKEIYAGVKNIPDHRLWWAGFEGRYTYYTYDGQYYQYLFGQNDYDANTTYSAITEAKINEVCV